YPSELQQALAGFGLAPTGDTPPILVRDALSDLYRYELRRMREQLRAGATPKNEYIDRVIALRKRYWPLTLQPDAWEKLCASDGLLLSRTRMVHITEYPSVHERQYYRPSDLGAPIYNTRIGRIGVAICYDRHFPEYMRALGLGSDGVRPADLVVVPQAGLVDE